VYDIIKRDINKFDTIIQLTMRTIFHSSIKTGLMKEENNGAIMIEFVGLRAKMYVLRVNGKKDTKKVKGVKSVVRNR